MLIDSLEVFSFFFIFLTYYSFLTTIMKYQIPDILVLAMLISLAGCVSSTSQPSIATLLAAAQIDFEENRLTTPAGRNAYQKYQQILSLDAANKEATLGINTIVEQYLSWAIANLDKGRSARASRHLDKARAIDATHPNIRPVTALINKARSRTTTVYRLDATAVVQRQASKIDFPGISADILDKHAFVTIRAIDDATGRWLYRELNRYTEVRIEAMFEKNRQPSISLMNP